MRISTTLIEHATGNEVEAEIFDDVALPHFIEAYDEWRPAVVQAAIAMHKAGTPDEQMPRHWHWDWRQKEPDLRLLAVRFYGISCGGKLQGLMKVLTAGQLCRLPDQILKPLVYIDYLESAPWNLRPLMAVLGREPQYGAVGTRLVEAAVRLSQEEGFKGRVGLHSLPHPQAERFYLRTCRMTPGERDTHKGNMLWYEFTPEQAERFLTGEDL